MNKVKVQVILSIGHGSSIGKKLAQTYGFINTTFNESDIAWWTGTSAKNYWLLIWHEQVQEQSYAISQCMYLKYLRMSSNVMLPVSWDNLWHHWRYLRIDSEKFRCSILLPHDNVGNGRWCVLPFCPCIPVTIACKWLWKAWMKWELTFWTCSSSSSAGTSMSTRPIFCWRGRKRTQLLVQYMGTWVRQAIDISWYSILKCCDIFGAFFYDTDPSTATELATN